MGVLFEDQINPFPNVDGDRHVRALVQDVEGLILLWGDVHRR